jgi:hypothetical protein
MALVSVKFDLVTLNGLGYDAARLQPATESTPSRKRK